MKKTLMAIYAHPGMVINMIYLHKSSLSSHALHSYGHSIKLCLLFSYILVCSFDVENTDIEMISAPSEFYSPVTFYWMTIRLQ